MHSEIVFHEWRRAPGAPECVLLEILRITSPRSNRFQGYDELQQLEEEEKLAPLLLTAEASEPRRNSNGTKTATDDEPDAEPAKSSSSPPAEPVDLPDEAY